jgi:regulator of sirC expression with transglutaminase-like and TPR domain
MDLDTALRRLAVEPEAPLDLAEVALLLARDEYPDLDVEAYLSELAGMAHEVKPRLRGPLGAQLHGLCRYLFHEMGFRGNVQTYYDPRNSYLNDVLERRTGIPITLSTVAIVVGRRAGLDVVGVGLPGHFIARAAHEGEELLFDPFHGGRPLTVPECEVLVEQVTGTAFEARPEVLQAVPLRAIVARMLTNLKGVYLQASDWPRAVRTIERLCQLCPGDAQQRRDLGATLVQAGEQGRAIDHLAAYLEANPLAEDTDGVGKMLAKAKAAVARWN